jgi:hypothetical protein
MKINDEKKVAEEMKIRGPLVVFLLVRMILGKRKKDPENEMQVAHNHKSRNKCRPMNFVRAGMFKLITASFSLGSFRQIKIQEYLTTT